MMLMIDCEEIVMRMEVVLCLMKGIEEVVVGLDEEGILFGKERLIMILTSQI